MSKVICVDANFVVFLVQAISETSPFIVLWDEWQERNYQIIAPTLFGYEVTNVFHRMSVAGQILSEEAEQLLEEALSLEITFYGDRNLHERAMALAKSLNLHGTLTTLIILLCQKDLMLNFILQTKDYLIASKIQLAGFI